MNSSSPQSSSHSLPLLLRSFFVRINSTPGAEKIIFPSSEEGMHYTIRFWSRLKYLDLHLTNEKTGAHETLFQIKYFTLIRLLARLIKIQQYLFSKYVLTNTINPGKLKQHNCILIASINDESEAQDFLKIKDGYIKFRKNVDFTKLNRFILLPSELSSSNKEAFHVFKVRNRAMLRQGIIYKQTVNSNIRYLFFTKKMQSRFAKQMIYATYNLLKRQEFENKNNVLQLLHTHIAKTYPASSLKAVGHKR
jgi:hypothetical protein